MAMAYSVSTVATFGTCWVTLGGITSDTKKENNEISRREGWDPINMLNPATCLCLS